jgi:(p)ppGpp synthase/HD superfamily hydrolase
VLRVRKNSGILLTACGGLKTVTKRGIMPVNTLDYQRNLEQAIAVALAAHAGQKDKSGLPVISHLARVASRFESIELQTLSWLHDVIARGVFLEGATKALSFLPSNLVEALSAISRRDGEKYSNYINRCSKNSMASMVKIKDINDNLRPIPTVTMPSEKQNKLYKRRLDALEVLKNGPVKL